MGEVKRGYFLTFDGIVGANKTKLSEHCAAYVEEKGLKVIILKELNSTELGRRVRKLLYDPLNRLKVTPISEVLLFETARAQLVEEKIAPALAEGITVIASGFALSTLANQGYGHFGKKDSEKLRQIMNLNNLVTGEYTPDITFVLDQKARVALRRASRRKKEYAFRRGMVLESYQERTEGYRDGAYMFRKNGAILMPRGKVEKVAKSVEACLDVCFFSVVKKYETPEVKVSSEEYFAQRQKEIHDLVLAYQKNLEKK